MQQRKQSVVVALIVLAAAVAFAALRDPVPGPEERSHAHGEPARYATESPRLDLTRIPPRERNEVARVAKLIDLGGPFDSRRDGTIFRNAERRLPIQARGYYREYTVRTPGMSTRGARRIVAGANGDLYYTRDHYRTFVRIRPPRSL